MCHGNICQYEPTGHSIFKRNPYFEAHTMWRKYTILSFVSRSYFPLKSHLCKPHKARFCVVLPDTRLCHNDSDIIDFTYGKYGLNIDSPSVARGLRYFSPRELN